MAKFFAVEYAPAGVDIATIYNIVQSKIDKFTVIKKIYENENHVLECWWAAGSGAITLADYNAFPVGTIIHDIQAHKDHEHATATTWVSSAART